MEKFRRAGQATDDNIIRLMRIACWIHKATNPHSEYAIIIAFRLQQWLLESASMIRYRAVASFVRPYVYIGYINMAVVAENVYKQHSVSNDSSSRNFLWSYKTERIFHGSRRTEVNFSHLPQIEVT